MKKKLIITGASGFLAFHLLRATAATWDLYGFTHLRPLHFDAATAIPCNLTNYIELGNYLEDIEPDALIHLAAIADANFCQTNKAAAYAVNVEATKNLAGLCSDFHIPFVFTSTDLVFDGIRGNYSEADAKNPLNAYGEQKAIAEDEVLKIYPEATVLRLPLLFGQPEASAGNYLQQFILRLQKGQATPLFTDEYRSVCGAQSISRGILQVMNHPGILHLAGTEKLSRYDFGMKAVRAFGLDASFVQACLQKDVKMAAPRPPDVSLNIAKALNLGYSPLSVEEELRLISTSNYFP